ncbi:MAG: immune inhibitor A [Acidimicrobiia bacterium]|nr:immune inhibitor A [Acidimicrobiia bacterium]
MRKSPVAIGLLLAMVAALLPLSGASAADPPLRLDNPIGANVDDIPHPLGQDQRERRAKALEMVLQGKAEGPVVKVAKGQFVELEQEDEDLIWTVLGEFGDQKSPFGILQGGLTGPQHNQIPEPDRSVDNSTIWEPDFDTGYYEELLFGGDGSMRDFYEENSSGRYTVDGDVTDWGQVQYRAAHYGRDWCGSIVCGQTTWWFVQESVNDWYASQIAGGMTADEIDAYLSKFDVWDRYDFDGDGNFDEPDGYIDHFQAVHAGAGQETGGGAYGSDAIWSHRWYVQLTGIGAGGPILDDGTQVPFGGTQVGNSKYWIGDYTIEPENGGVGVFAHEFAHDLGLPDLYDTSGNTCGSACENSTAWWTLMSSGSYGNDGTVDIGTKPTHMGAWEKFQLGWLNYEVAFAGERSTHRLGPASTNTKQAQALFTVLPDKLVTEVIGSPFAGEKFYYSGQGNNLDHVMYREFDLGAGSTLSARVDYDIEVDWDYAYLVASSDGGSTWEEVETSVSTSDDPNGQNFGYGITGSSGGWVSLTADLSGYSGPTLVGFRYWTDVAVVNPGFKVDEITIGGEIFGAEVDGEFTLDGFVATTGTEEAAYFNAYVAENRAYYGFDDALRTGPYNFGFLDNPTLVNWVERFSYEDGLLISYWDSSQTDNSTSAHPGEGLILPIDAHPATMYQGDGGIWRSRIQSYDSTFGLEPTAALTLHWLSQESHHPSQPAVPVFDDTKQYYNPETPTAGVINPNTGTQIRVVQVGPRGGAFMQVRVQPSN